MYDSTEIRPPRGSGGATAALLCLCTLAALAGAGASFGMLDLVKQAEAGADVSQEQWGGALVLAGLQGMAYIGLVLLTGVFFMVWLYKAVRFARYIAPEENQTSPAWAAWSFIVPIAWWFVPVRATYAAYKSCHAAEHLRRTGQPGPPAGGLVALWWCAWIAMTIVNQIANNVGEPNPFAEGSTAAAVRSAWQAYLATQLVSAVGGVLAVMVVAKLTGVQARLADLSVEAEFGEPQLSRGGLPGMPAAAGADVAPPSAFAPQAQEPPAPHTLGQVAPDAAPDAPFSRSPLPGRPTAAPADEAAQPQFMPGIPPPPPQSEAA